MVDDFRHDIEAIGRIPAVPTILDVVCRITGMGFAAVARVTEDRWIACSVKDDIAFGLKPGGELKVETTICNEIRQTGTGVVIDHVSEHKEWCAHPTPAAYGFQSYISMPIVLADGSFFGTLCSIDPKPARLNTTEIVGMFKLFAELIAFHLDAEAKLAASGAALRTSQTRLAVSEANLQGQRDDAVVREQFIAVLGHDLRNPLAAIDAGAHMLERMKPEPKAAGIITMIHASVARMSGLIANVLDFARGRLGEGIILKRNPDADMEPVLQQVMDELRAVAAGRTIELEMKLGKKVNADPARIAQLFSNLLANALTHGAPDKPVRVSASTTGGAFELSVANAGEPIEPDRIARLFEPFARGDARTGEGLGLGLYIASEIARAHGGELEAMSDENETRFTFRMPLA